jgi:hypothetical protein
MEPFARIVVGYHGCTEAFAKDLLLGKKRISDWLPSQNEWDWLGHGIYFWEHAPARALRWAREKYPGRRQRPTILGAYLQLGRCFDLLDEAVTALLAQAHEKVAQTFALEERPLPENRGPEGKRRELDCLIINSCLRRLHQGGAAYDTVRGAFLEGEPAYPGAGFARESHIQIAVRNSACILGVFRPNIEA